VPVGTKIVIAGGEIAKPGRRLLGYSATVDIFDAKVRVRVRVCIRDYNFNNTNSSICLHPDQFLVTGW